VTAVLPELPPPDFHWAA